MIKFLWRNLDHYRKQYVLYAFLGLLLGVSIYYMNIVLADFAGRYQEEGSLRQMIISFSFVSFGYLIIAYILRRFAESMTFDYENYFKQKYFKRMEGLPIYQLQASHSGYLLSSVNKVASGMRMLLMRSLWNFWNGISILAIYLIYIAKESALLAVVNIVAFAVFIVLSGYFSSRMAKMNKELFKRHSKFSESLADFMTNIVTIKKLSVYDFADKIVGGGVDSNKEQIVLNSRFHAMRFFVLHTIFIVVYALTVGYFSRLVALGEMGPHILIFFVAGYGIIKGNIDRSSEMVKEYFEVSSYTEQLEKFFSKEKDFEGENSKPVDISVVEIKDLMYQYKTSEKMIDLSGFSIRRGEVVCVIGESGQGKSTLLNALNGSIKLKPEQLHINSQDFFAIEESYLRATASVSQEVEMFNQSLRDNIILGKNISDEVILQELADVGMKDFASSLKDGLDTIVGEKGLRLSVGQKQRVNLLRGMLLDRQVYLLDEPTSHLDEETEKLVVDWLAIKLAGKTAVIVTHRDAILKLANKVYRVENHKLNLVS